MSAKVPPAPRLKGAQRNVDVWQRILKVRGLVVSVQEDTEMWIKYANLCRKSNRVALAYKTLASVYGQDPERPRDPVRACAPLPRTRASELGIHHRGAVAVLLDPVFPVPRP